jgi:hypothetical protein
MNRGLDHPLDHVVIVINLVPRVATNGATHLAVHAIEWGMQDDTSLFVLLLDEALMGHDAQ